MKKLALFTGQLVALLRGGLPLVEGLSQLGRVFPYKEYKRTAGDLATGLVEGYGFADQLKNYPRLFPAFYLSVVEIGEGSDSLIPALQTLEGYYDDREKLKNRFLRIMFYPLLLLAIASCSGAIALWYVVPGFSGLYGALGAEVPTASRWIFILAQKATPLRLFIAAAGVLTILGLTVWFFARRVQWRTLARFPLVHTLLCYWFCKVTAMITATGHTLEQALSMAATVSPRGPAPTALAALRQGESLYAGLAGSPGVLRLFIAQGEQVGELPQALAKAAEYYSRQLEEGMENFQRLLEPLSMLLVGGAVAAMLLVLMLPVLELARVF